MGATQIKGTAHCIIQQNMDKVTIRNQRTADPVISCFMHSRILATNPHQGVQYCIVLVKHDI